MSKVFDSIISRLSEDSGYGYDFLVDRYNEIMDEDGDIEYFVGVTMERDWNEY